MFLLIKRVLGIKVTAKCGHKTRLKDTVSAFGEKIKTQIKPKKGCGIDYCHKCLEKMAIQCAWCGKPIFIGDPVTLYSPKDSDKSKIPSYATLFNVFNYESLQLVGCGRSTCADTGADYAGIWIPGENGIGKVYRRPIMFAMSLASMNNGGNGVIVGEF